MGVRWVIDSGGDYRQTVFLAGTGRSGGGWIAEIINQRNDYRYIFEPFHPKRVPWVQPFPARNYLRPDDEAPEFLELTRSIVTGQIRHPWTERFNRRLITNRRLIKEDFANLSLKWISVNFPEMPLVLLLRHPCAVAASYLTHGYEGAVLPLLAQERLVADYLDPHVDAIQRAADPFERTIYLWCVETLVPLKQFRAGEIHVVFYENMLLNPQEEIATLFSHIGQSPVNVDLGRLSRPSLTARRKTSAAWTGEDKLTAWEKSITPAQRERANEILSEFGLDSIYTDLPTPHGSSILELMKQ